jgi:hypothetical protein
MMPMKNEYVDAGEGVGIKGVLNVEDASWGGRFVRLLLFVRRVLS